MVVFPQLSSGAGMQFPSVRRRTVRAAMNELRDGSAISYADPAYAAISWELAFRDLTDDEAAGVSSLFEAVEGRRGTFTFVDPTANLLAFSEDLSQSCWSKSPLVRTDVGVNDPLGGTRAIRLTNTAMIAQVVSQQLAAPASFVYAFSVYARAQYLTTVALSRAAGGNTHKRTFDLGSGWTRCVLAGAFNSSAESVVFGFEVPEAGAIEVFGFQVEAQPCASAYKKTGARNGVYSSARFGEDTLRVVTDGPDQHRFQIRITAKD